MITQIQRKERLRELGDEFLELYGSLELTNYLISLCGQYGITDKRTFADVVGDALLGFIEQEDLPAVLADKLSLNEPTAIAVIKEITPLFGVVDARKGLSGLQEILDHRETTPLTPEATESNQNDESFLPHTEKVASDEATAPENLPTEEQVEEAETIEETPVPSPIPSYKKPLTDTPRYDNTYEDPYHERPDKEEGEDERAR